jgi:hypothetical protein
VGLESVGMSLEDIFIKLVTGKPGRVRAVRLNETAGDDVSTPTESIFEE